MITLVYMFRSGMDAKVFAFKIRNETIYKGGLKYLHARVHRKDHRVTITHDEKKLAKFPSFHGFQEGVISFIKELTYTAERFHGYAYG